MKLLLAVVYFFVEMFCIVEFADEFGILVLFLEIIVSAILGFGVMFGQYSMLPMAYSEILNGGIRNFIGRKGRLFCHCHRLSLSARQDARRGWHT